MTRVSEYFRLHREQPVLDFVDVDIDTDLRVFVDPRALRLLQTDWGHECVALIQDFFSALWPPFAMGTTSLRSDFFRISKSPMKLTLDFPLQSRVAEPLVTNLLEMYGKHLAKVKLQDRAYLKPGRHSAASRWHFHGYHFDITTNIIRQPVIHYTQAAWRMVWHSSNQDVDSGPIWDPDSQDWFSEYVSLPMVPSGKLLLVPKVIVRRRLEYDAEEYYRHYILEHLRSVELAANSELVQTLRRGRKRVTKKALTEKYGRGKDVNLRETRKEPSLLTRYRDSKKSTIRPPLDHEALAAEENTPEPDWDSLLNDVLSLPTGQANANHYERAIESLHSALFYPSLSNPQPQRQIHDGRKRIDLTYTNVATRGFFHWLSQHYPAPHIFVECKNYVDDPANPN